MLLRTCYRQTEIMLLRTCYRQTEQTNRTHPTDLLNTCNFVDKVHVVCPYTYSKVETGTKKLMECTGTDISHDVIGSHVMSVPVLTHSFGHGRTN